MSARNFYSKNLDYSDLRAAYENDRQLFHKSMCSQMGINPDDEPLGPSAVFSTRWAELGFSESISTPSDKAMFLWHVGEIKDCIDRELQTINDGSKKDILGKFSKDITILVDTFKNEITKDNLTPTNRYNVINNFVADAKTMVDKYSVQVESKSSWKPVFRNILLLLSVIGFLPAIISIGHKAKHGNYLFFDSVNADQSKLNILLPSALKGLNNTNEKEQNKSLSSSAPPHSSSDDHHEDEKDQVQSLKNK